MARYRSRLEIVADVLGVVSGGARKTKIMYQANLSYKLLTRYLKDVIDMGLVRMENEGIYELTDKGSHFLQEFKGYYDRREEIEEQLTEIQDEKMRLEERFLNAKGMNAGLKNCPSKKREKKRVA